MKKFDSPLSILECYSQENLWELKQLEISADYKTFYSTDSPEFTNFVKAIFWWYQHGSKIKRNSGNKWTLSYYDFLWRKEVIERLDNINFFHASSRAILLNALGEVREDWSLEKRDGFGVKLDSPPQVMVDPMFDSELFTVFDVYKKLLLDGKALNKPTAPCFIDLLRELKEGRGENYKLFSEWLPVDVFICEEHLKNWLVKKIFAETFFLHPSLRTGKILLMGNALLNQKRMSASRGHAVLTRDLILEHGSVVARLIILLTGGHLSKAYNYDPSLPKQARKMLSTFWEIVNFLKIKAYKEKPGKHRTKTCFIRKCKDSIETNVKKGYFRQAVIELLIDFPELTLKEEEIDSQDALGFIKEEVSVFLPQIRRWL